MKMSKPIHPGHKVVECLKSFLDEPKLSAFLSQARDDADLYDYLFIKAPIRIKLLKMLLTVLDDKLESHLFRKEDSAVVSILKELLTSFEFCTLKDSISFIDGGMPVENQCLIWEKILSDIKDVKDLFSENSEQKNIEFHLAQHNLFFGNPLFKEFFNRINSQPKDGKNRSRLSSDQNINEYESDLQAAKLMLENLKKVELQSPKKDEIAKKIELPTSLPHEVVLNSIHKWENSYQNHLKPNLGNCERTTGESMEILSENILDLHKGCSEIEKTLKNQKLISDLTRRIRDQNTGDEKNNGSQSFSTVSSSFGGSL